MLAKLDVPSPLFIPQSDAQAVNGLGHGLDEQAVPVLGPANFGLAF
jgi:hypothetical protein